MASMIRRSTRSTATARFCFIAYTIKGVGLPFQGPGQPCRLMTDHADRESRGTAGSAHGQGPGARRPRTGPACLEIFLFDVTIRSRRPAQADRPVVEGAGAGWLVGPSLPISTRPGLGLIAQRLTPRQRLRPAHRRRVARASRCPPIFSARRFNRTLRARREGRTCSAAEHFIDLQLELFAEGTAYRLRVAEVDLFVLMSALQAARMPSTADGLPTGPRVGGFPSSGAGLDPPGPVPALGSHA